MLSAEQVKENADTYLKQFFKIVDKQKTEVRFQSEWFGKFSLVDVVKLTSKFTVAQFLQREDFAKRFAAQQPIAITELLYPLLQAYDSVAIKADIEMGGTDQKFNFLVGRELQAMMGQPSQQIFMTPLLVGLDGVAKMSKSLGNYIGVAEAPEVVYGKTMSIKDDFIMPYYELLTDVPDEELAEIKKQIASGVNPMSLKKRLAREILVQLFSEEETKAAESHFERTVQNKELPDEIEEYALKDGTTISQLMVEAKLTASRSEAVRMIKQGGVTIDGQKIDDFNTPVVKGVTIKVGKRRYLKTK
jgi:tyrosyl-tRNA synthetase